MTLKHLKIFVAVYREMNITHASETLHMTQPAVTRAIQELEKYYGVRLQRTGTQPEKLGRIRPSSDRRQHHPGQLPPSKAGENLSDNASGPEDLRHSIQTGNHTGKTFGQ